MNLAHEIRKLRYHHIACIQVKNDKRAEYTYLELFKKKDDLVLNNLKHFQEISDLVSHHKERGVEEMVLLVSGKNTINRSFNDELTIKEQYPELQLDKFMGIQFNQNGESYYSFARIDYVQSLIKELFDEENLLLRIELHNSPKEVRDQIEREYPKKNEFYHINGFQLDEDDLNAYSATVKTFANSLNIYSGESPEKLKFDKEEKKYKYLFSKAAIWLAFFLFTSALISTFYARKLNSTLQEQETLLAFTAQDRENLKEVNQKMKRIDELIKKANLSNSPLFAEQAYYLGNLVPNTISMKSMSYRPEAEKRGRDFDLSQAYQNNLILLEGEHTKVSDLNQFIIDLKKLDFVGGVNLTTIDRDKRSGKGKFTIAVTLNR